MRAFEALISELGRRIAGIFTIPLAVNSVGGSVTIEQSILVMALLFIGGFLWVYLLRIYLPVVVNFFLYVFSKIKG